MSSPITDYANSKGLFDFGNSKNLLKPTSHKSDFSFSSPQDEPSTAIKQALFESRRSEFLRNRRELFTSTSQQVKQNLAINKYSKEVVEHMRNEHRTQVQKLLIEISRLHSMLEDQDRAHRQLMQRLRQEGEQIAMLKISHLKQSQSSQIQVIELQLNKTRQALEQKCLLLQQMEKSSSRKIQSLIIENQNLKGDLRDVVEKKNNEIHELRSRFTKQTEDSARKRNEVAQQMKQLADRQLKKILKKLQEKEQVIKTLSGEFQKSTKDIINLEKIFNLQRQELTLKLQRAVEHQRQRHNELVDGIKKFYENETEQLEISTENQRKTFKTQIEQLLKIIQIRDNESQRNLVFKETEKIDFRLQIKSLQQENTGLKSLVADLKRKQLQQVQLLKVKMAILHQNDIESLVHLNEAKIQALTKQIQFANEECERASEQMRVQRDKLYEMKKKYDYTISFLNQEIRELKLGIGNFEKQHKEKLENEKSMMMLTSRNFIKDNETKVNNIRFYEEELRKLRQLLQIQAQEVQQSEKNVEEKIKLAEDELSRLSNKIIEVKSEAEQSEKALKQTIEQKNKQIKRLNQLLTSPTKSASNEQNKLASELRKLDEELTKKQDELRTLRNRCEDLQTNLKLLRSENERLHIEAQINTEDAKKQYKVLSDKNLADMKAFYERRIQQLENDKKQLDKINSSQSQQITELVKKYKTLEQGMRELLRQTKKKMELETKIINLGTDQNLVKNMSELFHRESTK